MPRREGDKILFDSDGQRERIANSLLIGEDEFHLQILRLMAKTKQQGQNIWRWLEGELKGQIAPDEVLVYRHDINEMHVVKSAIASYPERKQEDPDA